MRLLISTSKNYSFSGSTRFRSTFIQSNIRVTVLNTFAKIKKDHERYHSVIVSNIEAHEAHILPVFSSNLKCKLG